MIDFKTVYDRYFPEQILIIFFQNQHMGVLKYFLLCTCLKLSRRFTDYLLTEFQFEDL